MKFEAEYYIGVSMHTDNLRAVATFDITDEVLARMEADKDARGIETWDEYIELMLEEADGA